MEKAEFYEKMARRVLKDVVMEEGEAEANGKNFAEANDLTLYSWRNDWLQNLKGNKEHFGYFNRDHSVKVFFNELTNKPIIIVGAGSSLQGNIEYLKLAQEQKITIMACHHALMYLVDYGIKPSFIVALDAGKAWDDYFAFDNEKVSLKDIPLLAEQCCNTEQLKKWQGPVYFFRSAHPDPKNSNIAKYLKMEIDRIIKETESGSILEVGGHVAGSMLSLSRGIFQAKTVVFVGCDYAFSPNKKFYPFDYKIDQEVDGKYFGKEGQMRSPVPKAQGLVFDIFGNMVETNGAYLGFKNVMDQAIKINSQQALMQNLDIEMINACEGGALGALKGGNSKWMKYMRLEDVIYMLKNKEE